MTYRNRDGHCVRAMPASLFGEALDSLARQTGGWPDDAIPYAVEVIGEGDDPQILLTGEIPIGTKRDGSPKFGKKQRTYKAAMPISQYRAALKVST
jgi:hypothetical protein